MRVEGRWHLFKDGVLRPVVEAVVQTPVGDWQEVRLLLDAGADRTVFDASFLPLLSPLALPESQSHELGGIGGKVPSIFIQTRLVLCARRWEAGHRARAVRRLHRSRKQRRLSSGPRCHQ